MPCLRHCRDIGLDELYYRRRGLDICPEISLQQDTVIHAHKLGLTAPSTNMVLLSGSLSLTLVMELVLVVILSFALVIVFLLSLELFILAVCRNLDTLEKDLPEASEAQTQQSEPQPFVASSFPRYTQTKGLRDTLNAYDETLAQLAGRIEILACGQAELRRIEARIPQQSVEDEDVLFDLS
ncbi:hypothetical protein E4T39_01114 [Aureobasidium subglaciale]|nr:hypothetical protein E4T39_01114 [Aureobasidium subglaciale]